MAARPRDSSLAATRSRAPKLIQTNTRARLSKGATPRIVASDKVHTPYIPRGKTVARRRW